MAPIVCKFYLDEQYQDFLDLLQGEELQVQGDFDAKVGDDQHSSWPEVVGKFGLGRANDRGQLLQLCTINVHCCQQCFNMSTLGERHEFHHIEEP